jgi:hypothetical protein
MADAHILRDVGNDDEALQKPWKQMICYTHDRELTGKCIAIDGDRNEME